jgi:hypothetical protein
MRPGIDAELTRAGLERSFAVVFLRLLKEH